MSIFELSRAGHMAAVHIRADCGTFACVARQFRRATSVPPAAIGSVEIFDAVLRGHTPGSHMRPAFLASA